MPHSVSLQLFCAPPKYYRWQPSRCEIGTCYDLLYVQFEYFYWSQRIPTTKKQINNWINRRRLKSSTLPMNFVPNGDLLVIEIWKKEFFFENLLRSLDVVWFSVWNCLILDFHFFKLQNVKICCNAENATYFLANPCRFQFFFFFLLPRWTAIIANLDWLKINSIWDLL